MTKIEIDKKELIALLTAKLKILNEEQKQKRAYIKSLKHGCRRYNFVSN